VCECLWWEHNNFLSFRFLPQETWNWNPKLHFTWDKHDIQHRTKHARLLGGRYGVRCKRANMQKRGLIERNWSLCSFIIWECKDNFRVLVCLIFVPRFFRALPRCQGKIDTQKLFLHFVVHDSRFSTPRKKQRIDHRYGAVSLLVLYELKVFLFVFSFIFVGWVGGRGLRNG